MKTRLLVFSLCAAFLAAGCGKRETAASATTSGTPSATAATPAPADAKPSAPAAAPAAAKSAPRVVEITGNDAMKFSLTTIDAKVGEEITVKLTNVGTLPKEAMGHNFVLLKPGTDAMAFATAAMMARDTDYVPAAQKGNVIAHTKLLGPKQTDEVTFKITAAGEYPFICSFPAHAAAGMKGVLVAK